MNEISSQIRSELDCEVNVYDGSWATCDMAEEEDQDA
jgi:hypothetical protein